MSWILIKKGEPYSNFSNYCEFQISSEADISNPSEEANKAAPSSKAFVEDFSAIYNKANDGTWKEV